MADIQGGSLLGGGVGDAGSHQNTSQDGGYFRAHWVVRAQVKGAKGTDYDPFVNGFLWPADDLGQKYLEFGALQLPGRAGAGARAAVVAEFVTHLVAKGLEVFHDVRMLGFDVGGFADVLFHVEQRQPDLGLAVAGGNAVRAAGPSGHGAVAVREVQLPSAHANGLQLAAVVEVIGLVRAGVAGAF